MKITRYSRPVRTMYVLLPSLLLMAMQQGPAFAALKSVSVGTTSWSPTSQTRRTPLFRNGDNTIEIIGKDAGILNAAGVEIREYCNPAGPGGRLIAMGSIRNRSTVNASSSSVYVPTGKLTVSIPLMPTQALGNYCGQISYPGGYLVRDNFTVKIYRRGTVKSIAAPTTVRGNTDVNITFRGAGIGNATSYAGVSPFELVQRVRSTDEEFTARVTFRKCGTFTLAAQDIYDRSAPGGVIDKYWNRYIGSSKTTVKVSENCSRSTTNKTYTTPTISTTNCPCGTTGCAPCGSYTTIRRR